MSATSFLRHRRATAMKYLARARALNADRVAEILAEFNLSTADLETLSGNTDILTIADRLVAERLGEAELDTLEELNTVDVGDRAAVHSPDVRDDQFEDKLQHPCQETVGVGNMHDGPEAAEDLGNVSKLRVDENDGSLADAIAEKADEMKSDPLAQHRGLPEVVPTSAPAAANQVTAEDDQTATDPEHVNPGPETVVDLDQAATDQAKVEGEAGKLEKLGEAALAKLDRDQLLEYADRHTLTIDRGGERTHAKTLATRILEAQKGAE